jgi:hypothetical protein
MNLQLLTNGTPDEKKWLDIVCYDIKCNSITPNVPFVTTSDKIESNDLSSSITCNDIGIGGGGMSAVGNIDMNLNLLRNVSAIDTTDATLNITTPTTQIENGSSELNINIDSLPRITQNAIKTKLECGASRLQLAAISDLLTDDTSTYFASQNTIATKNMAVAISPDLLVINQDYGVVNRLLIDDATTALYSKNALSGPNGSSLSLNNDGTFTLSSYFAGNGTIECQANSMAIVGPQAKSSCVYTDATISTSLFNGSFTANREIMDATSQTFKDGGGIERLRVDNSGVSIGNSYTLPTSDGLANQYIYTNGAGVCSWASPTAINPFNQNLNTSDSVQFVNVNVNGNYTLPSTAGTINQVLTLDSGTTSVWSTPQIYGLYSATGTPVTVANSNVAATIIPAGTGSLTVPANFFTPGMSFLLKCGGTFRDSSNGQQFTMRLTNSGTLFSTGLLAFSNVALVTTGWNVETQFTFTGGTQIITNFTFSYNNGSDSRGFTSQQVNNSFNPLVSNTLDFTMQWNTANVNNTLTCNYFTLTKLF